jgi:hypothetical protein
MYNSFMSSDLNEGIRQDLKTQLGQGITARFTQWCFGPGYLGCHVGLVTAITAKIVINLIADVRWDFAWGICGIIGYIGGISGMLARDEFLREGWARYRPVVGLVTGMLIGLFGGWLFLDGWIALASAIGGGIGGLTDAIVYRSVLESDW